MSQPTVLVTGSAGHLGKALMLALPDYGYHPIGIDINPSETTTLTGSITDTEFLASVFSAHQPAHVIHAATLHKPHVASHTTSDFIQTNITGTLALLEAAAATRRPQDQHEQPAQQQQVKSFTYISTTSTFGRALSPAPTSPAAWIDEDVVPVPKNIYGVTKTAAEDLCRLVHDQTALPVVVLRTSRFFPEDDDDPERTGSGGAGVRDGENLKVLELAYRRVDVADVVGACVCVLERVGQGGLGWGRFVVSGVTPFGREGGVLRGLNAEGGDMRAVFEAAVPGVGEAFARRGWGFGGRVDRVYDSGRAVRELGWRPVYTFQRAVERVARGEEWRSELSLRVGKLGYHAETTGVYTTRE